MSALRVHELNKHDDGYELVGHPKNHDNLFGDYHDDAEWDDCDFEVKEKNSDPNSAAPAPEVNKKTSNSKPAAYAPEANENLTKKKKISQERVSEQMAAAKRHLQPEMKRQL